MPDRCSIFVTNFSTSSKKSKFRYTFASHPTAVRMPKINPYEVPNYTIEESARYLHIHPQTVTYWVIGNAAQAPLSTIYTRRPMLLSFKNLVECFVLESLRKIHGMSLPNIRYCVEKLRLTGDSKYPLADYDLHTDRNRAIYLDENAQRLTCLTHGGQLVFRDIVLPSLKRVERNERGIAQRLFPFTSKQHLKAPSDAPRFVVIDPKVSFGMPVLIDSRISTAFLLSRKKGGASAKELATDYGRPEAEIEEALRLEQAA